MGLYALGLQEQKQAVQAGKMIYPLLTAIQSNTIAGDEFQREAILPTGGYTLYTTATTGSGSSSIIQGQELDLSSGTTIADDVDVRLSGQVLSRVTEWTELDNRSQLIIDALFRLTDATTSTEGFVGIITAVTTSISALPTTARHMGIFWDRSAGANFTLTSADGTTQSTTGTGDAIDTGANHRIRITQTGLDSATIQYYEGVNDATATATQTVSAYGVNNSILHFFVQTEAAATRGIRVNEWRVDIS